MPGRREGVGDYDIRSGSNVVSMYLAHRVGMRQQCRRAPRRVVHGHPTPLELRAHRTIEDEDLSPVEPLLQSSHPTPPFVAFREAYPRFRNDTHIKTKPTAR